ncbi:MAG: hypothetical protein HY673_26250 [Chloroflexi bacterium]|nr:hypothetical protein [Chloroflexota bacterium]
MAEKLVFLSEADDDLQAMLNEDKQALVRRINCYVLLSDGVILHPAYIWQSATTNELVSEYVRERVLPSVFRILVGESKTVAGYIADRTTKVSPLRTHKALGEYRQYRRWGDIKEQALAIDKSFPPAARIFVRDAARDKKFRALVVNDVSENVNPYSLYSQISSCARAQAGNGKVSPIISRLTRHVESAKLVSVESVSNYVETQIDAPLARSLSFKKRMLDLYYHCYVDERISVPGLHVVAERIINPFDVETFWTVFARLFGNSAAKTLSRSHPEVTAAVIRLRGNPLWEDFRRIYFSVLQEIETSLWKNIKCIQQRIEEKSGYDGAKVLKRIWRERKLQAAAVVFGALALVPAGPIALGLGSAISLPAGVASSALSVPALYRSLRRFVHDYHNCDFTRLKHSIYAEIENLAEAFRT